MLEKQLGPTKHKVTRLVFIKHTKQCPHETGPVVCEAHFEELYDTINRLEAALNEIYAIAGEDPQIAKICNDNVQPF